MVHKHVLKYVESHVKYNTNFKKVFNHFNFFVEFAFFHTQLQILFMYKYILMPHDIYFKNWFLVYFVFWVLFYHKIQKHCETPI